MPLECAICKKDVGGDCKCTALELKQYAVDHRYHPAIMNEGYRECNKCGDLIHGNRLYEHDCNGIRETPDAGDGDTVKTGGPDTFTVIMAILCVIVGEAALFFWIILWSK